MQKLNGRLKYLGWSYPCTLSTRNGKKVNIWLVFENFFESINGKPAKHCENIDDYKLMVDVSDSPEYNLEYFFHNHIVLNRVDGLGCSNVVAYLIKILTFLSGRLVKIEIENEKQILIMADKTEKVYGVYYLGDGNSCYIPKGIEKTVCKIGQGKDTCIFVVMTGEGFRCEKFSILSKILLDRLAKGTINAKRIGNCRLIGRKKIP